MAGFNEIQHGRINRFLQKWSGIKGRAPVSAIASEVTPQLSIHSGVEDRFVQSWDVFHAVAFPAAVAGQFASIQIRNPAASGVVGVIEAISAWVNVTVQEFRLSKQAIGTDLTPIVAGNQGGMDPRGRSQPTIIASFGSGPFLTTSLQSRATSAQNTSTDFILTHNQEFALLPGDAYRLTINLVNQGWNGFFRWRERALEDAEKF
jgi:hypothetical protein